MLRKIKAQRRRAKLKKLLKDYGSEVLVGVLMGLLTDYVTDRLSRKLIRKK